MDPSPRLVLEGGIAFGYDPMADVTTTDDRKRRYRGEKCRCPGTQKIQSRIESKDRHCHHGKGNRPRANHVHQSISTKDRQEEGERPEPLRRESQLRWLAQRGLAVRR